MVCETRRQAQETEEERRKKIDAALQRLAQQLGSGVARIVIGPQGQIAFSGWQDRADVADACAFRALTVQGSWELKQALARAEALAGRKANVLTLGAGGQHSHDGGATWHQNH